MRFIKYTSLFLIFALLILHPATAQQSEGVYISRDRIRIALRTGATVLDLSQLELEVFPPELLQLTALETLSLSNNRMTSLPPEIGQLTKLQTLVLLDNQLTSLPPEIGQLTELRLLSLQGNQLTRLPSEIGQLTKLERLLLSDNQIRRLPASIGQVTTLREISLTGNPLVWPPPEIVEQGSATTIAYLKNNERVRPANRLFVWLIVAAVILVLAIALTFRKPNKTVKS